MSEKKLERILSVLGRTADTRSGWYAKVLRGEAPKPVKLAGGRAAAWVSAEIDDYIEKQIAARDANRNEVLAEAEDASDKAVGAEASAQCEVGTQSPRNSGKAKAGGGTHA